MKRLMALGLILTSFAHASYYVECGIGFNEDHATFKKTVFKASSADDRFVGRNNDDVWSVATTGNWLPAGSARAKVLGPDGNHTLSVVISKGQGLGEIGKRYDVSAMYDDRPTLKVFEVGGFAGGTQTATYECYTSID